MSPLGKKKEMKLFEITQHNSGGISGVRLGFLWIFSATLTHSDRKGSHLNIGLGVSPFEISTQLSIWRL